jgi:hypothetical protein
MRSRRSGADSPNCRESKLAGGLTASVLELRGLRADFRSRNRLADIGRQPFPARFPGLENNSSGPPISNPGEPAEPPLAVTIIDRGHLFDLDRHELPDSRRLTMILHQHGLTGLSRGSFPSALTNHTVSGGIESRPFTALIPKPPHSKKSVSIRDAAGHERQEFYSAMRFHAVL